MCGLALCWLLCGCGEGEEVLLIGERDSAVLTSQEEPEVSGLSELQEESELWVYVCGAVVRPGVVCLPQGSRWSDALEAAGGFREDAGTDYVNLAAKISDGERLYFPTLEEGARAEEAEDGLVNINTADAAELCTLPGIGESRAADIIRYRETCGGFETCEDIMKVSGIKESVYAKLCDRITVE